MTIHGAGPQSLSAMIFYLMPVKRVRDELPASLSVEEVLPGMTIGGFYASRHHVGGESSGEFGVAPAFVRSEDKKGFYISRLISHRAGSDDGGNSSSLAWSDERGAVRLMVSAGGREMVNLRIGVRRMCVPVMTTLPFLMTRDKDAPGEPIYRAHHLREFHFASVRVSIPASSPLSLFADAYKLAAIVWEPGEVVAWEPRPAEAGLAVKPRVFEV